MRKVVDNEEYYKNINLDSKVIANIYSYESHHIYNTNNIEIKREEQTKEREIINKFYDFWRYINSTESVYSNQNTKDKLESTTKLINELIELIKNSQKDIYINAFIKDSKKSNKKYENILEAKKKIELYLFYIYIIIKNFPIYKNTANLEKYYFELSKFKKYI